MFAPVALVEIASESFAISLRETFMAASVERP